jgi:diguanylate cyclase (GGDEF)-like protein
LSSLPLDFWHVATFVGSIAVAASLIYIAHLNGQLQEARTKASVEERYSKSLISMIEQMKQLTQVASMVSTQKNLPDTLQLVVNATMRSLGATYVTLIRPGEAAGVQPYWAGTTSLTPRQWGALAPQLLASSEPLHAGRERISEMLGGPAVPLNVLTAVPLRDESGSPGALVAEFQDIFPTAGTELDLLKVFADNAMIAIANARVVSQIQQMAITDELTGLFNRRYFMQELGREIARVQRSRQPFALLMIDIDWFKQINDQWGHSEGDRMLKEVAGALKGASRKSSIIARYGGEEFVCLLPETPLAGGVLGGERLREAVAALTGMPRAITISVGVAAFPDHGSEGETLIIRADEALYAAKAAGRNCVLSAQAAEKDAPATPNAG